MPQLALDVDPGSIPWSKVGTSRWRSSSQRSEENQSWRGPANDVGVFDRLCAFCLCVSCLILFFCCLVFGIATRLRRKAQRKRCRKMTFSWKTLCIHCWSALASRRPSASWDANGHIGSSLLSFGRSRFRLAIPLRTQKVIAMSDFLRMTLWAKQRQLLLTSWTLRPYW